MGRREYIDEDGNQFIEFSDGPLPGTPLHEWFCLLFEIEAAERGEIELSDEEFADLWYKFREARKALDEETRLSRERADASFAKKQSEPAP